MSSEIIYIYIQASLTGQDFKALQPTNKNVDQDSEAAKDANKSVSDLLQEATTACEKKEHGLLQLVADVVTSESALAEGLREISKTTGCDYKSFGFQL